jgi:prephenate dehydrogenase
VVVIGTGLIGTSVALALRGQGATVWLSDRDRAATALAAGMGAGRPLPDGGLPDGPADVAVLAVPPAAVAPCLAAAQRQGLARCYTDVASVKELPLAAARQLGCDLKTYVPGHPLSGRERAGAASARADLFLGRPWAICPSPETAPDCVEAVRELAGACGAQPVVLSPADHDRWVALVSHVPHLVAAAVAAGLESAPDGALALAGPGLRDVTRIAAGDAGLWTQILAANAAHAGVVARAVAAELQEAARALDRIAAGKEPGGNEPGGDGLSGDGPSGDEAASDEAAGDEPAVGKPGADERAAADTARGALTGLLRRGSAGVARLPGKRGAPAPAYAVVQVVIGDRPGELARLLRAAGEAGVNIEDVGIEHSPGLPAGVAELSVRPEAAAVLTGALAAQGWPVRPVTSPP